MRLFLATALAILIHIAFLNLSVESRLMVPPVRQAKQVIALSLFQVAPAAPKATTSNRPPKQPKPNPPPPQGPPPQPLDAPQVDPQPSPPEVPKSPTPPTVEEPIAEAPPVEEVLPPINKVAPAPMAQGATEDRAGPPTPEPAPPVIQPAIQEAIPLYRLNPKPGYPAAARRRGYQGTVMLKVLVGVDGSVLEAQIEESSGFRLLDRSALSSVQTWQFEPGTQGEIPVEMWVKVPVRFSLK